jgi:hypothetical protein
VRVSGHGLSIDAPAGWEARIFKRPGGGPVLHAATFALQERDGDFGAAATGRMGGDDVFLAVLEFRRGDGLEPGAGLFAADGRPRPAAREFLPNQLQVTRPGQYGWQRFYSEGGRPCCVYAVVMPARLPPARLVADVTRVLTTLHCSEGALNPPARR